MMRRPSGACRPADRTGRTHSCTMRRWAGERRAAPLISARQRSGAGMHCLPSSGYVLPSPHCAWVGSPHAEPGGAPSAPARAVFVDGVYFSANLNKVPMGGWFAVAVACAVFATSELWQFGTKRKQAALSASKARGQTRSAHVRYCAAPRPGKPAAHPGSGSRGMCVVELHRSGETSGMPSAFRPARSMSCMAGGPLGRAAAPPGCSLSGRAAGAHGRHPARAAGGQRRRRRRRGPRRGVRGAGPGSGAGHCTDVAGLRRAGAEPWSRMVCCAARGGRGVRTWAVCMAGGCGRGCCAEAAARSRSGGAPVSQAQCAVDASGPTTDTAASCTCKYMRNRLSSVRVSAWPCEMLLA